MTENSCISFLNLSLSVYLSLAGGQTLPAGYRLTSEQGTEYLISRANTSSQFNTPLQSRREDASNLMIPVQAETKACASSSYSVVGTFLPFVEF